MRPLVDINALRFWSDINSDLGSIIYHGLRFISINQSLQIRHNFSNIVVGNLCTPPRPDSVRTVHQHHWNYGSVKLGLYFEVVVKQGVEQWFIIDIEQDSC